MTNLFLRKVTPCIGIAEEIITTDEVKWQLTKGSSSRTMEIGYSVPTSSRSGDQLSTLCVQIPLPVPVITYTPTVLPAKMDLSSRVLKTIANMEQNGPF